MFTFLGCSSLGLDWFGSITGKVGSGFTLGSRGIEDIEKESLVNSQLAV